ncbi:ROK family protein [Bacillus sp. DJP31]|uniref:ROK family protein n=1 Tax=Bacillus sp. DJP31 TaxID=3409789 RepID=UPI003BB6C911
MSSNQYSVGVDLGGTNVRVALLNELGDIITILKEPTEASLGPEHVISKIKGMIEKVAGTHHIVGIGIGSPGPLNPFIGVVMDPPNLPGWSNVPIRSILQDVFSVPVFVDNDANVAGLAEAIKGAGKGYSSVVYITWSTGIGAGIVLNGRILQGATGNAGEIGNMIIVPYGKKQSNLNGGALEAVASGTAIGLLGKELLGPAVSRAEDVFQLASEGNESAKQMVNQAVNYMAIGISNLAHTLNPSVFVLGGGVMNASPLLLDELTILVKGYLYESMQDSLLIKKAELGDQAGIVGAGFLPFGDKGTGPLSLSNPY